MTGRGDCRQVILLLTACVKPNYGGDRPKADVELRRREYVAAVEWYLLNTPYKVVLCDNSGTDITADLRRGAWGGVRLEVLTYSAAPIPASRSYGYGEMDIVEYALAHSRLLCSAGPSDIVVKITGRLKLLNIRPIVSHLLRRSRDGRPFVSAYVNGRAAVGGDCRFIFSTPDYMRRLAGMKQQLWFWFNFERVMTCCAFTMMSEGKTRLIFPPLPPRVSGESGGRTAVYDTSTLQYVKACVKHAVRKVLFDAGLLPRKTTVAEMIKVIPLPAELAAE